jgi:hypothetical protein
MEKGEQKMNKKFDCQVGEVFPIVDRESVSDIVLVKQAFVVCDALRGEEYSYEKFLVEYELLESMVFEVLKDRDREDFPDDLSYLEEGSDMFSRVYQTYIWARFNVDMCKLSEDEFLQKISEMSVNLDSEDKYKVSCLINAYSDILSLLKKKYIYFEGIEVIENYIFDWNLILDDH